MAELTIAGYDFSLTAERRGSPVGLVKRNGPARQRVPGCLSARACHVQLTAHHSRSLLDSRISAGRQLDALRVPSSHCRPMRAPCMGIEPDVHDSGYMPGGD